MRRMNSRILLVLGGGVLEALVELAEVGAGAEAAAQAAVEDERVRGGVDLIEEVLEGGEHARADLVARRGREGELVDAVL
jgi:hypothetical protein